MVILVVGTSARGRSTGLTVGRPWSARSSLKSMKLPIWPKLSLSREISRSFSNFPSARVIVLGDRPVASLSMDRVVLSHARVA